MGICLITGDHPRHKYLASKLHESGKITGWIIEKREEFNPVVPIELDGVLKKIYIHHFKERSRIENMIFKGADVRLKVPTIEITKSELNKEKTFNFLEQLKPRLVISYGCHKLSSRLINIAKCRFWNIHGGLSPDYRGVITHFWPSYFLEPQMTGITLHETTNFLDAGSIIFQTAAPMVRGDTLHRLAARNIEYFSTELAKKINKLNLEKIPHGSEQDGYGKVFMASDWRPEHLVMIYEIYNDAIVDALLDGNISGRKPNLVSILNE
jgi:folate-dependent phosphoribosylglycinamide formyltransferase PurN